MTTMIQELAAHPELIFRVTVDEYHEMLAKGILASGDPFELLDGQIVRKIRSASGEDIMTIGVEHTLIVSRLAKLNDLFEPLGCYIRSQQPVTIVPRDEPEPDAAIVKGSMEDYTVGHPGPQDIFCIVEVAESSLARDRGYKSRVYAAAGVPMYVIVNLVDRVVEVYEKPAADTGIYNSSQQLFRGDLLNFPTASGEPVAVPVERMFMR